jgi:hypothetical protein
MKITAAQHVSAVLTPSQSPRGYTGHQTVFYTQERLTPDEVSVVERQVQYSPPLNGKAKWQSYRLTERRHVISRIVPIPEADSSGRPGRFFAHSMICDVPGGQQFDVSLFGLLRAQNFFPSLDRVLNVAMKTEHLPVVTLDAGDAGGGAPIRPDKWSGEQLNQLYMLMSDPRLLTEQGQYVALLGSEEQILEALRVAFMLAPAAARKFCSFDTNAFGGDAADVAFWGRGAGGDAASTYVIDAARQQVTLPEWSPLLANGFSPERVSEPLRKAIRARLAKSSRDMLLRLLDRKYTAFVGETIYQALLGETELPLTPADMELLSPFGLSHDGLGLLLSLKSGDDARRLRTLAAMNSSSYKEYVGQLKARPGFKPWQAFSPVFMPTWFDLFREDYGLDDLTTILVKVSAHGSEQDREYVETIHERLDPARRQALGSWLKASHLRFNRLQAALDSPVRESADRYRAARSRSFLRRIFHSFGK